jgi:hypothetical protein
MRIVLAWLADFAWILYAACGLGALICVVRALSLRQRVSVSLTSFERETTVTQAGRFWRGAAAFLVAGIFLFAGQVFLLAEVLPEGQSAAELTPAGLMTFTPVPLPSPTPLLGILPTITATVPLPSPPPPPIEPTATPATSGEVAPAVPLGVRLGDVAELVGYDLSTTELSSGQGVGVILYWRALEGAAAADYWVFTHLLPPELDRLVGQHDGAPVGGTRPTSGWVAGEVVADYHELALYEPDYAGTAQIAVGLYNPADQVRVPTEGGQDFVLLPTTITFIGP